MEGIIFICSALKYEMQGFPPCRDDSSMYSKCTSFWKYNKNYSQLSLSRLSWLLHRCFFRWTNKCIRRSKKNIKGIIFHVFPWKILLVWVRDTSVRQHMMVLKSNRQNIHSQGEMVKNIQIRYVNRCMRRASPIIHFREEKWGLQKYIYIERDIFSSLLKT